MALLKKPKIKAIKQNIENNENTDDNDIDVTIKIKDNLIVIFITVFSFVIALSFNELIKSLFEQYLKSYGKGDTEDKKGVKYWLTVVSILLTIYIGALIFFGISLDM